MIGIGEGDARAIIGVLCEALNESQCEVVRLEAEIGDRDRRAERFREVDAEIEADLGKLRAEVAKACILMRSVAQRRDVAKDDKERLHRCADKLVELTRKK